MHALHMDNREGCRADRLNWFFLFSTYGFQYNIHSSRLVKWCNFILTHFFHGTAICILDKMLSGFYLMQILHIEFCSVPRSLPNFSFFWANSELQKNFFHPPSVCTFVDTSFKLRFVQLYSHISFFYPLYLGPILSC